MQPNPALLDLEHRKKKSGLAHELGFGAACTKCGDKCSGFELHYWRKVCINCRCGKAEHNVKDEEDHGFSFIGKIFDRPMRTKAEECKFIYGEVIDDTVNVGAKASDEIVLDWAPPGVSNSLASKYLRSLPEEYLSIQGSQGAVRRKMQLEKQFPLHDVEPGKCHQLSEMEMDSMTSYVDNVKKNVIGQGILHELGIVEKDVNGEYNDDLDDLPPPLPPTEPPLDRLNSSPPPLPPPPMDLLDMEPLSYSLISIQQRNKPSLSGHSYSDFKHVPLPFKSTLSQYDPNSKLITGTVKSNESKQSEKSFNKGLSENCSTSYISSPTWECIGCSQSMLPGDVAIFAERVGPEKCWHPTCFCCTQCGEILEDLLYYHNKGKLYCGRHYAEVLRIPRCAACDELIFSAEYTGAEDKFWHIRHFCCWLCDSPLAGQQYIPVNGQPHCLSCWQGKHGKKCSACGDSIDAQGQRVSLGDKHWHASPTCFKCGMCGKSLLGGKMSRKHGTLLCSSRCGQVLVNMIYQQQLREDEGPKSIYKVSDL